MYGIQRSGIPPQYSDLIEWITKDSYLGADTDDISELTLLLGDDVNPLGVTPVTFEPTFVDVWTVIIAALLDVFLEDSSLTMT